MCPGQTQAGYEWQCFVTSADGFLLEPQRSLISSIGNGQYFRNPADKSRSTSCLPKFRYSLSHLCRRGLNTEKNVKLWFLASDHPWQVTSKDTQPSSWIARATLQQSSPCTTAPSPTTTGSLTYLNKVFVATVCKSGAHKNVEHVVYFGFFEVKRFDGLHKIGVASGGDPL